MFSCHVNGQVRQDRTLNAELFTIEEGLSQTRVNVNYVDSYGFLWVGTSDGLNRYNGYNFRVFRHQPFDSASISNNYIRCITEDDKGNLWVGTNDGLNFYDRQTGEFTQYKHSFLKTSGTVNLQIYAVFIDSKHHVWFKTERHLHKLNLQTGEIKSYKHFYNEHVSPLLDINCEILEDINGLLWFGTKDGLFAFNQSTGKFTYYFHDPLNPLTISSDQIRTVFEDKNGELWIGTTDGLNRFDRIHNTFRRFYPDSAPFTGNPVNAVNSIEEDRDGMLWLTTNAGISRFDKRNSEFVNHHSFYIRKSPVKLSAFNTIVMDRSDILWAGGFQGLIKIDLKPRKFRLYNSSASSFPRLTSDMVSAIFKDDRNRLWVGLWNSGLDVIQWPKGDVTHYSRNEVNPSRQIISNNIRSIVKDRQGKIWIGTSEGVSIYIPAQDRFYTFSEYFPEIPGNDIDGRHIFDITQDRRGDIWIGTDDGAFRYQRNLNLLSHINKIYNDSIQSVIKSVYSIVTDKENKVWLGTTNGLISYSPGKNIFYLYSRQDSLTGLAARTVYSLFIDSRGVLWIGTPSGLSRFHDEEKTFTHYTEKEGLPNNFIYKILEDSDSLLWLSTNKGLSRFNPETGIFTNYTTSEGLQSYEFNLGTGYYAHDHEMFFGGIAGFNAFYPGKLPVNPEKPEIVITSLETIDEHGISNHHVPMNNPKIIVQYNQSFTIRFSALDFTTPSNNRYRYSLKELGRDEKWIPLGNQHSVTFSNLTSGEYVFRVTGTNNDGIWNDEGAQVRIIVEAPFWKTRLAYFSYILLGILLVYALTQYRTKTLRRSNRILRERDVAAREVARQKDLLSRRNKNIEDSLKYAQRIQQAMLTTSRLFKAILPGSFILHKPKEIVSGDFYWISEMEDKVFVAAVDCTGHGVPGAFMSLIGFELFRKIINTQHIFDPGGILNGLNSNFEEIFGNVEDVALKDGMDLAFCVLDKKTNILEFAGAFNPLYLIRENKLIEVKGDRFSVGADTEPDDPMRKVFTSHKMKLEKDDMIYIFTDGYADQFGGPEGKKYKYRRFRHLLLTIHQLPLAKQREYLEDSIEEWRGNLEQIDDILVIGIKPEFGNGQVHE